MLFDPQLSALLLSPLVTLNVAVDQTATGRHWMDAVGAKQKFVPNLWKNERLQLMVAGSERLFNSEGIRVAEGNKYGRRNKTKQEESGLLLVKGVIGGIIG